MNLINVSTSIYKGEIYVFSSNIHIGTASSFKLIKYKINRGGFRGGGGGGGVGNTPPPPPCLIFFLAIKIRKRAKT